MSSSDVEENSMKTRGRTKSFDSLSDSESSGTKETKFKPSLKAAVKLVSSSLSASESDSENERTSSSSSLPAVHRSHPSPSPTTTPSTAERVATLRSANRKSFGPDFAKQARDLQIAVDFEKLYYSREVRNDPIVKESFIIPPDDVSVAVVSRQRRTLKNPYDLRHIYSETGELKPEPEVDVAIRDCVDFYNQNWKVLKRKFEDTESLMVNKADLPIHNYELEIEDELADSAASMTSLSSTKNTQGSSSTGSITIEDDNAAPTEDELPQHILQDYRKGVTDEANAKQRELERKNIFFTFPEVVGNSNAANTNSGMMGFGSVSGKSKPPAPFSEKRGIQVMVTLKSLSFALEKMEPFFCSLAAFDVNKKKKISENFYFDFNDEDGTSSLLQDHMGKKDPVTTCKKAIFNFSQSSPDIFFVLRVEKVLQGDNEAVAEPYIKFSGIKDKEREKLSTSLKAVCARLGSYRQPFCWGMFPAFGEDSKPLIQEGVEIKPLYRQKPSDINDDHFLDTLTDTHNKGGSSKRYKVIPGACILDITEVKKDSMVQPTSYWLTFCQPGRVDPSLVPLGPESAENSSPQTREIQEFRIVPNMITPHLNYVNNLYIYPDSVNLSNRGGSVSARNIAIKVQLLDKDELPNAGSNAHSLKAFYGKSSCEPVSSHYITSVTYHNKQPTFYDEIKVMLPLQLHEKHHILFTFYHVACQPPKPKEKEKDISPVGYAVLPLYQKQRILDKEHTLPVMLDLVPHYLLPEVESTIKYIDNKKPLFKVYIELVSTVYSTDKNLSSFWRTYYKPYGHISLSSSNNNVPTSVSPGVNANPQMLLEQEPLKSVRSLLKLKPNNLIHFFPILFHQLFKLLAAYPLPDTPSSGQQTPAEIIAYETFVTITNLLQNIYNSSLSAQNLLSSYTDFAFDNPNNKVDLFHELVKLWNIHLKKNVDTENSVRFAWFLFRIIYKSMVFKAHSDGVLGMVKDGKFLQVTEDDTLRNARFSNSFMSQLTELTDSIIQEIQRRTKSGLNIAKELNKSFAVFLRNLLSVMDRGFVFQLLFKFTKEIAKPNTDNLIEFKFEFLKFLTEYEHFVPLSLPSLDSIETIQDILPVFCKKHFMSGLMLSEVSQYLNYKDKSIRDKVVGTLKMLLMRHDKDKRYQDKLVKQRISAMYFPFLLMVIDNLDMLDESDFDEKRNLLVCFLFILKNVNRNLLSQWWSKETQSRLLLFLEALHHAANIFEFVGEELWLEKMGETKVYKSHTTKAVLENYYNEGASTNISRAGKYRSLREKRAEARKSLETRRKMSAASQDSDSTAPIAPSSPGPLSGSIGRKFTVPKAFAQDPISPYNELMEMNLSCEVSFILLDIVEHMIHDYENDLRDNTTSTSSSGTATTVTLMDKIMDLFLTMLRKNQSDLFFQHLYTSLASFVSKFSKQFFIVNTTFVAELCLEAVRHANSRCPFTRTYSTAFLYLLMKRNYEEAKKNFSRVKVQITIAIAKLVGKRLKSAFYLRQSLASISKVATVEYPPKKCKPTEESFRKQVEELCNRLYTILRDSIKINEYRADPEMIADLYHRIAKGYTNAPDLRVTWLESLAEFHYNHKQYSESSMCVIHIAALIAEYLNLFEPTPGLPQGCAAFQQVSPNVIEESAISDISPDEEGICESFTFTEAGLLKFCNMAVERLKKAELFEAANDVYKLIVPIYEKNRDYENLARCHADLQDVFNKIILSISNQNRLLGSYYRVGLFGKYFEELDGKEFVYKEPKITRLGEIQDRLKDVFGERFGNEDKIKILTDSGNVDKTKLEADYAYIQLTSVAPYLESWELKDRVTYFERNNNINRFIFSTPFTMGGRSQADQLNQQYRRKTILTVENQFPYVKKRLQVVDKQEIILSPIENSIEVLDSRTDALYSEMRTNPPNPKTLQPVLQGIVLLQVNAGPKDICRNFLAAGNVVNFPADKIDQLKQSMREMLKACEDALALNKKIIQLDQVEFHNQLELGFKELKVFCQEYNIL